MLVIFLSKIGMHTSELDIKVVLGIIKVTPPPKLLSRICGKIHKFFAKTFGSQEVCKGSPQDNKCKCMMLTEDF